MENCSITVEDLCQKIKLPLEVQKRISDILISKSFDDFIEDNWNECVGLSSAETSSITYKELNKKILSFSNSDASLAGFYWLSLSLKIAVEITFKSYKLKGISDTVFYDTMGAFSRFVAEHKKSFGCYGFDRAFWTYRQLSGVLFRIGTLEYELCKNEESDVLYQNEVLISKGEKYIYVHIPSDADLKKEASLSSIEDAKSYLKRFFKDFSDCKFFTETWLLSPSLNQLLNSSSKILQFQNLFNICSVSPEREDYIEWVFKTVEKNPQNWKEETSLQRSMKKFILEGGKVGVASGVLK